MNCKICASSSIFFANAKLLNKYDVDYFKCRDCGFVQTEDPYWLAEAYSEAIAGSDIGLVTRNMNLSACARLLIEQYFNADGRFLDYGGGYGLFVRLMRDKGFDFYWSDKFCKNLFAQGFEDQGNVQYELITAFELLEHLVDPVQEISEMLKLGHSLLFSTSLLPDSNPSPDEWWYYARHEGQHIAIYTPEALKRLSQQLGCNLYSDGESVHLITRKTLPDDIFATLGFASSPSPRISLLGQDAAKIFAPKQIETHLTVNESPEAITQSAQQPTHNKDRTVIIDGVFFQLYQTGIARLWESVLEEWSQDEFRNTVVVLDRNGTCPKIPGIRYRTIPPLDYGDIESDRSMLQDICDEEQADLFISTYYTTPISTPSVFMGYDMIPEVLDWDLSLPMWQSKHHAIQHASAYMTISENTSQDLQNLFSDINPSQITTTLCGVAAHFQPASPFEIMQFRDRFNIQKPYFLLIGPSMGYKNGDLFLQGLSNLSSRRGFEVICTGSNAYNFSAEARKILPDVIFHPLYLNDQELRSAYTGAVALVYPSKYEGFGLPVLEAMKCGCPVITAPYASLPEVAGEAAIYVNGDDIDAMTSALSEIQNSRLRTILVQAGHQQASKFTWSAMAQQMKRCLMEQINESNKALSCQTIVLFDWTEDEDTILQNISDFLEKIYLLSEETSHEFLVDTNGIDLEDADMLVGASMMNFLMEHESPLPSHIEVRIIEPINNKNHTEYRINSQICLRSDIIHLSFLNTISNLKMECL